uniref:Uncharacterized protein n=1 Tax=Arundo donax TaxID=35708 RepID=A0A0A8Z096_ARUDO
MVFWASNASAWIKGPIIWLKGTEAEKGTETNTRVRLPPVGLPWSCPLSSGRWHGQGWGGQEIVGIGSPRHRGLVDGGSLGHEPPEQRRQTAEAATSRASGACAMRGLGTSK